MKDRSWQLIVTKKGKPITTLTYNDEDLIFCCDGEFDNEIISHIDYNIYINGELTEKDVATKLFNVKH